LRILIENGELEIIEVYYLSALKMSDEWKFIQRKSGDFHYLLPTRHPAEVLQERRMLMEDEKVQPEHWNVKLFPNPANNNFFLDLMNEEAMDINVSIIDFTGKEIDKRNILKVKGVLNFNYSLTDGIYLVRLINLNTGEEKSLKLLISR